MKDQELADALRGLIKLVDDGDLVRNTDGDDNILVFMRQGVRITNALKAAQDALSLEQSPLNGIGASGAQMQGHDLDVASQT